MTRREEIEGRLADLDNLLIEVHGAKNEEVRYRGLVQLLQKSRTLSRIPMKEWKYYNLLTFRYILKEIHNLTEGDDSER